MRHGVENEMLGDIEETLDAINDYQSELDSLQHLIKYDKEGVEGQAIGTSVEYHQVVSDVIVAYCTAATNALPKVEYPSRGQWRKR